QDTLYRSYYFKCRDKNKVLQFLDPATGSIELYKSADRQSHYALAELDAGESLFVIFSDKPMRPGASAQFVTRTTSRIDLTHGPWKIQFDKKFGGPEKPVETNELKTWTSFDDPAIKYYSGTVVYSTTFNFSALSTRRIQLNLDSVYNI